MKRPALTPFVPLTGPAPQPAAGSSARFVATVPPAPAGQAPSAPAPAPATAPTPHAHPGAPRLTFQRDGDRITRILVHCSCGEVIPLDCRYTESDMLTV